MECNIKVNIFKGEKMIEKLKYKTELLGLVIERIVCNPMSSSLILVVFMTCE